VERREIHGDRVRSGAGGGCGGIRVICGGGAHAGYGADAESGTQHFVSKRRRRCWEEKRERGRVVEVKCD